MKRVEIAEIVALQKQTSNIRNICVIAHIDHGKTTLTDSLICSNGIISPKLAGKLRFLDSTEDEQQRGITMHSSAISLLFKMEEKGLNPEIPGGKDGENNSSSNDYLINLIDSPGHIDFSSDVSTATRLCDGALIVIDVLEGICTQTHAVIYKALKEGLTPCLVLNKIDRLCLEMQLTCTEAFYHLRRILENVNALTYTLLNSELQLSNNVDEAVKEQLEDMWNFTPSKGNVIFASAFDTWGFSVTKFINMYARKLGFNRNILQKYIFEDYAYNETTKKLVKYDMTDNSMKPMFAAMILEPIWKVYDMCITQQGQVQECVAWFASEFGVTATPRDINIRDGRLTVRALMRSWLPLSEAILRMVVRAVPNPAQAQQSKMSKLVFDPMGALQTDYSASWSGEAGKCVAARLKAAVNGISSCDNSRDCDVVVFLSKMVPVRVSELRSEDIQHLNREIKNKDASAPALDVVKGEVLMSLGRVFSGVVTRQSRLLLLPHRHDPITDITANFDKIEGIPLDCSPEFLTSPCTPLHGGDLGVYLVFGPSVIAVDEIPAGNIIGIVGIADYVLKTGTLSSTWACPTLKAMTFQAKPIVRVAVEPVNYYDLARLEKGLRMLYQYDPAVEVGVDVSSGQQTMACLGEIHQEQCVKYLVEKFAKCEIRVSEPIVPFRESLLAPIPSFKPSLPQPWRDQVDTSRSPSSGKFWLDSEMVSILIRCVPLPLEFIQLFDDNLGLKSSIQRFAAQKCIDAEVSTAGIVEWDTVSQILMQAISEQGPYDGAALERRIVALGPDEGDAINVAVLAADFTLDIWEGHKPAYPFSGLSPGASLAIDSPHDKALQLIWARCQSAVAAGFQLCVASGPLMGEPLHAVCFIIEKMHISSECILLPADQVITTLTGDCSSGIGVSISTGQLIPEVRDALRMAYLTAPLRLYEPMYACTLQCDQMQLGSLYSVVSRRRGAVSDEDIIEGTSLFVLSVTLPIVESFGFSQELLKQTSGSATTPLLVFSHYQLLDVDPFWRPTTQDELEEFGDVFSGISNVSRTLIDRVRRRKGLAVEEKIVESAEKQRTLKR